METSTQKPAARSGDLHTCPVTAPNVHTGGPIIGPNNGEVRIDSKPAARLGDECICAGAIDKITTGSCTVFIQGKPAARQGDQCLHGGSITTGCINVLIGGITCIQLETGKEYYVPLAIHIPVELGSARKYRWPSCARRNKIIARAIEHAMAVLKSKLELLQKNDPATMVQFRKWFGKTDEWSKYTITVRIENEIQVMQAINPDNFRKIGDPKSIDFHFARIIDFDDTRTIYLGTLFGKQSYWGGNHGRAR